jgi:hypothetical protein
MARLKRYPGTRAKVKDTGLTRKITSKICFAGQEVNDSVSRGRNCVVRGSYDGYITIFLDFVFLGMLSRVASS